jgi:hypothetical protein
MEVLTTFLVFCRTWPCQVLITAVIAGAAAGAAVSYIVLRGAVKRG